MKYINYINAMTENPQEDLLFWVNKILPAYLSKNQENQQEIEHIIDYLLSDARPKRIKKMSYEQANKSAEKWLKSLKKKGADIIENESDIEVVIDFGDGMKLVKLVGDAAFKREGFLMAHCVGSFCGRDDIYSLRDEKNNPHCTIQHGQQVKGKGNGSIHPKYVDYIIQSLKKLGMPMRDTEMLNLGYFALDDSLKKYFEEKSTALYYKNYVYAPSVKIKD